MDQPITDYGAFLREARQAVAELNEMQQREGALNQQLNQSRRQLEAEEKAVADHISQTIKRRAADLASGYDKELNLMAVKSSWLELSTQWQRCLECSSAFS